VNAGGTYTVVATAANGCMATATANVIDNNIPITATVTPSSSITNITCTNTVVTLSASSTPTNDIVFVWSSGGSSANENVSLPGVVTVTLINSVTGCSTTAQFAVTQNTLEPDVAFANATFPCGPSTSSVNASSTNTNVTYAWTGTGIVSGASSASPEINSPGTFSVTITDNITGCSTNTTLVVGLATINASFTPSSNVGEVPAVISFSNQSIGADAYSWSFGDGGTSTDINPNYTYNTQGSYTVILTASAGLCSDTATTIIIIDEGFEVYIPNVFTPNNDGPNDLFYIKTKGVKDIQGDIFNRWGQLMYSMKGVNDFWDGKAANSELVPDGTYFYILNITDNKNKTYIYNGSVNLYR
jgi:gliding motility-associated-like protein